MKDYKEWSSLKKGDEVTDFFRKKRVSLLVVLVQDILQNGKMEQKNELQMECYIKNKAMKNMVKEIIQLNHYAIKLTFFGGER